MTLKVNTTDKNINIKVPNWLIANRLTFFILKCVVASKLGLVMIFRIRYKKIKPLLKLVKKYKKSEIVSVHTQQGVQINVSL